MAALLMLAASACTSAAIVAMQKSSASWLWRGLLAPMWPQCGLFSAASATAKALWPEQLRRGGGIAQAGEGSGARVAQKSCEDSLSMLKISLKYYWRIGSIMSSRRKPLQPLA